MKDDCLRLVRRWRANSLRHFEHSRYCEAEGKREEANQWHRFGGLLWAKANELAAIIIQWIPDRSTIDPTAFETLTGFSWNKFTAAGRYEALRRPGQEPERFYKPAAAKMRAAPEESK